MSKDSYAILGIPRSASQKRIKKAYRYLVRKYHPDINKTDPQAEEKIKKINEAYEVLTNLHKKEKNDEGEKSQNTSSGNKWQNSVFDDDNDLGLNFMMMWDFFMQNKEK